MKSILIRQVTGSSGAAVGRGAPRKPLQPYRRALRANEAAENVNFSSRQEAALIGLCREYTQLGEGSRAAGQPFGAPSPAHREPPPHR